MGLPAHGRWRVEGEAAFQPHSRRPRTSPTAIPAATIEAIANLRADLRRRGLDHGPATIAWHLDHHAGVTVSRADDRPGPDPRRPGDPGAGQAAEGLLHPIEAAMPNECWQSDFTHWALADGADTEILTFLDDCTRFALSITAHRVVTTPIVLSAFRGAVAAHGIPASTLTDNGMVFTVRLAGWGSRGGRNAFEHELRRLGVQQKNGSPWHPQTQGKVERFQQTMKRWLAAQRPASTLDELQTQLDAFATAYNEHRPHRSLPHHATPATRYRALPKAGPSTGRDDDTHDRVRHDKTDRKAPSRCVTPADSTTSRSAPPTHAAS